METVTVEQVMSWKPCGDYDEEKVRKLCGTKPALSALEILSLNIPDKDKLWAVLRNEFFTDKQLRHLACDFAGRVLPIWYAKYPDDHRPRICIETARRYADGQATNEDRAAAWEAAGEAARAAAGEAARATARAAARAAAWEAAWEAARAAAWEAAGEAAGEAAWEAARATARAAAWEAAGEWQVERVRAALSPAKEDERG